MDLLIDILVEGEAMTRQKTDGTVERCSPGELIGKDIEIVSSRYIPFQDLMIEFERSESISALID